MDMGSKPSQPTKEERLAKALRENLSRRKALTRAKRERASSEPDAAKAHASNVEGEDAAS
jgi:UDP:flavonoid glycosyltransferase YjiC (YdhE family)